MAFTKSELPKISVITPSFNSESYIENTIRSVLNQDYPNLEYLVIDGGSTDLTLDILKKYNGSVTWISEKDRGQSNAINKGLHLATGDVIAYLNSDDMYEPDALHKVGRFLVDHPHASWITGKCRQINQLGEEIRKPITTYKNFWLFFKSYNALLVIDFISQPATFWCKNVINRIGSFNENLHLAMDYEYSLRVGKLFKLWVIDDYLASFRIHEASKSALITNHFSEDLFVAERYARSHLQVALHRLHNYLITFYYLRMQKSLV